jgi:hypothetical protein
MRKTPPSRHPSNVNRQRFGGIGPKTKLGWETASVLDYSPDTQTYLLRTESGRDVSNVGRLVQSPGENEGLPRDTLVAVQYELGYPVIAGVLRYAPAQATELDPVRVSEVRGVGGEDPVYAGQGKGTHRPPNAPKDTLPGDWVKTSPDGNLFAALLGGTNVMKSSAFAQIRTHGLQDLVEILSGTYRHLTSMGKLEVVNDGGKTSLIWRAGADQMNETGAHLEHWTIRLDVGATGDLFNFEITTPEGQTLARIHISADGRFEIVGTAGVDITSGDKGTAREDVAGDKELYVKGKMDVTVKGSVTETVKGQRATTISKGDSTVIGGHRQATVNENDNSFIGGKVTKHVMGGTVPTPGNIAESVEYVNGGLEVVIGNPVSGGAPSSMAAVQYVNYTGGYTFAIQPTAAAGQFNVVSLTPGSVNLGANGSAIPVPGGAHNVVAVAPFGVMKYEPFLAMMTTLMTWLATHFHVSAVGPTTPPATAPALIPLITPMLPLIRSVRVNVGL